MFGMPKCYGARPSVALLLIAGFVLAFGQTADAQGRGRRGPRTAVRGQIVAFDGNQLILKTPSGETVIAVSERTRVRSLTRVKFAKIKKGDFIASAGVRQPDGTLRAIEVRIFPEQLRGRGEGHRPFRGGPNSTMTNATVDTIVGSVAGRTVKVKYPGGEKTIVVPEDVLVMRQEVGDKSLLKPGAHVSVVAGKTPDGGLTAVRIKVGQDGLVPPT